MTVGAAGLKIGCPGAPDPDLPKPDWKQPVEAEHGLVYALRIRPLGGGEKQESG